MTNSNPPSSRPMTLRQQLEDALADYGEVRYPNETDAEKLLDDLERVCQEIAREAVQRYQELQHEELMNEIIKTDREARLDELNLMANHSWSAHRTYLFDRIAELTQKPPQPKENT